MKHLHRRTIIRQYEFNKKFNSFVPLLYSKAEFVPITVNDLEKEHVFKLLNADSSLLGKRAYIDFTDPYAILRHYKDFLYNDRYRFWQLEVDELGQIWVQSRKNTPRSILGWGNFDYWYE